MLHAQRLALVNSQVLRRTKHVLDFSPIEVMLCQRGEVVIIKSLGLELAVCPDSVDKELEDGLLRLCIKSIISQRDVDPRLERFIECLLVWSVLSSVWAS